MQFIKTEADLFLCRFVLLLVGTSVITVACEDHGALPIRKTTQKSVVCLSPAMTQMMIDLECVELLGGVGRFDPVAPDGMSVVGDLYDIDYEMLISINPTDIFIQPTEAGVSKRLRELAKRYQWQVYEYRFDTINDVLQALRGGDEKEAGLENKTGMGIGVALGVADAAKKLATTIESQLDQIQELTKPQSAVDVLLLVGDGPLTGVGPDTFLGELLVKAGGRNVISPSSNDYPVLDKETVFEMKPQVIILLGNQKKWGDELPESLAKLNVPAVVKGRIYRLKDKRALLPSSSMPFIAAQLAKLLHPELSEQIDKVMLIDPIDRSRVGDDG